MSRALVVAVLGAALVGAALVGAVAAAPPARAASATTCRTPFTAAFVASLRQTYPTQRVTASVYDTRTGCWYSLNPGTRITTASMIKAGVMGAVLLRAQDRGRGPTAWERARITPMIRYSYNNPYVSDLLGRVGGVAGMTSFDHRMGALHTSESLAYGATWTTAHDRTLVMRGLVYGGGPLRAPARATAWSFLRQVTVTQRWGITAGLPAGWEAGLKNGFYPMSGYGWRVGSSGYARPVGGRGYVISVLTDHNRNQVAGISLVQAVSRQVARTLAGPHPHAWAVSRSRCVTAHAGWSWRYAAGRVGLPTARWSDVRRVSGGNPSPLEGQRVCSPVLRSA